MIIVMKKSNKKNQILGWGDLKHKYVNIMNSV